MRLDQLSSGEASEHDCWRDRHHSNAPVGEQPKLLKFNQRMLQTSPFLSFFCLLYNVHCTYNCTYKIVVWLRMQVRAVFRDPEDSTCLSLLFANQTEDDILLRCTRIEFIREREETLSITGKSLRRWRRRTRTDSSCGTLLTGGGKRGSFCLNRFQKYLPLCLIGRVKTGSTVLASSTPR